MKHSFWDMDIQTIDLEKHKAILTSKFLGLQESP
jgi:hypothetical protein